MKLLLTDDSSDQRRIVKSELEKHSVEVVEAENGQVAIKTAEREQPDLVVLDLVMPVMDGLTALPEIRRVAPNAQVVILSSLPKSEMESPALERGAVGYVQKDTPIDQLFEEIMLASEIVALADELLQQAVFERRADTPQQARKLVEDLLQPSNTEELLEAVKLMTSELVTNAVEHGKGEVKIEVYNRKNSIRVEVSDESQAEPIRKHPKATEPSGRGMLIVEKLSSRWGVDDKEFGKTVWFEIEKN